MKKYLFFIVLFLLMILPINAKAYGIENYYINATIENNGDLLVEEYFNLTGTYNGFERIINYKNSNAYMFDPNLNSYGGSTLHNGSGIEILEVRSLPIVSDFKFNNIGGKLFHKESYASSGDYGVYTETNSSNGKSIKIFNPSSYENAFYIKYRLYDMAIKHNDVGELGWNIVGDELSESIGRLRAYINVPNNKNIKAWAHGPLNGKVEIVNPNKILISVDGLSSYRAIDVRTTFDLGVINNSKKTSNVDALSKILLYEEDKANQANYEREQMDKIYINQAESALANFEVQLERYYYDAAKLAIDKVFDEEIKSKFLERLYIAKEAMDKKEEKKARDDVLYAYEYVTYYNYQKALTSVSILDNEEVKNQLMKEVIKIEDLLREEEKKLEFSNFTFGGLLLLVIGTLTYSVYKLYCKNPQTSFNHKYFRDKPSDLSPESVSYLFNKKISNNALSASMIELVRKKIISVEKISKNNYKLINNSNNNNTLTSSEKKLLELIFHGRDTIETNEMEKYAKKNYDSYISDWEDYHKVSKRIAKNYNFFESDVNENKLKGEKYSDLINSKIIIILIVGIFILPFIAIPLFVLYLLFVLCRRTFRAIAKGAFDSRKIYFTIGFIILIVVSFYSFLMVLFTHHFYKNSAWIFIICLIISIIGIIMTHNKNKRTLEGAEEYNKWKALKNFLNDFGSFQDKEVISIVLWEHYLVYATLFGCADKVLKHMKLSMPDDPNGYVSTYTDLYTVNRYVASSVISSYSTARSAYTAAHSSSSSGSSFSSGSGGGGGFSSGGGSFGGGGGGGRF